MSSTVSVDVAFVIGRQVQLHPAEAAHFQLRWTRGFIESAYVVAAVGREVQSQQRSANPAWAIWCVCELAHGQLTAEIASVGVVILGMVTFRLSASVAVPAMLVDVVTPALVRLIPLGTSRDNLIRCVNPVVFTDHRVSRP
ncbi:hypothetical protein BKG57_04015 [Mycobacteroides chelonae]|nr:hypothetical protein BKG57_04015 [Mycobacteroides chelonae]